MPEQAQAVIRMAHIHKDYETEAGVVHVLKDVSVTVMPGEFVALMGPSGSGKSTFMNILGCLDVPTSGEYLLNGKDVGHLSKNALADLRNQVIGFVFQGFNLLARASLEDNVALPLVYRKSSSKDRLQLAGELLDKVGLAAHKKSRPNQISGGQQQRVAIARALVTRPTLILADEPTGNLDTATSLEIIRLFQELNDQEGITIVLVTHEEDIAAHAKRLIRLADGCVVHDGPVQQKRLSALQVPA